MVSVVTKQRERHPRIFSRIAEIHGSHGVGAIIPTIYSGPIDEMRADIAAVKKAMEMQEQDGTGKQGEGSRESLKT